MNCYFECTNGKCEFVILKLVARYFSIHLFILKSSETDIQLIQLYSMLLHKIFEEYDARAPLSKVSKI